MPQFLIDPSAIKDNVAIITGKDARHISTVLRLKAGDWIMLTDGQGHRWRSEITSATSKTVTALLTISLSHHLTISPVILAQAIIKHDRFEWMIQKAVELGCARIIPFTSERTIPKFSAPLSPSPYKVEGKIARWQKIADEAAKQCGTTIRPEISPPITFFELLERLSPSSTNILFYEGETSLSINKLQMKSPSTINHQPSTLLIIGPEGGFSKDEVAAAKKAGAVTCSLGPLILRVETASIAALTLVQYKLGYFDNTGQL